MSRDRVLESVVADEITRRELLRRLGLGGAALVLPGYLATGSRAATLVGDAQPKRGGRFTLARNIEPLTFDPPLIADNGSEWITWNIFDTLTGIDRANKIRPALAESWEITNSGKTYTFKIRKGVKFSDGTPLTIEDVVWSIQRAADPKQAGFASVYDAIAHPRNKTIRALGPNTLRIELSRPYSALLGQLNISITSSILPKKTFLKNPKQFALEPVGSGPFMLKQFAKGQFTHLVRNPHYWKPGKPYVDEVMIPYIPDDNTRMLKIQSGEVDAATDVPFALIDVLKKRKDVRVLLEPTARLEAIWLNNKKKPLNDMKVRQALNYATDSQAIVKHVLFGYGEVANSMMPKQQYWRSDIKPYPYDIQKAKSLMKQSSAPNGFTLPLIGDGTSVHQQIAQIVQASWAKIGVKVKIRNLDVGTAFTDFAAGNYWAGGNWFITADEAFPDELAELMFDDRGGTHSFFTWYSSKRANRLIDKAFSSTGAARAKAFGDLQQVTMEEAPIVPIYFTPARTAVRTSVHGFHTYVSSWWPLEEVWIAK
jgi:peptide/nickel transport system substrate-binding protein